MLIQASTGVVKHLAHHIPTFHAKIDAVKDIKRRRLACRAQKCMYLPPCHINNNIKEMFLALQGLMSRASIELRPAAGISQQAQKGTMHAVGIICFKQVGGRVTAARDE